MSADESDEREALQERLKSTLWYTIGKIVDQEALELNVNATPQFIGALTEMVWTQLETTTKDLESFAHHANRSTVNTDDVMLLARRNEGLESLMKEFIEKEKQKEKPQKTTAKGKGRAKK